MTDEYKIIRGDDENTFEDQEKFEDTVQLLESGGEEFETVTPDDTAADGGTTETEVVEETTQIETAEHDNRPAEPPTTDTTTEPTNDTVPETTEDPLAELGEELGTDPLSILPGHMVDSIQGQPAVNKRGYAMIAERYGISVSAEVVEFPWENEENRCVARATATTEDGREYSGYGTACAEDGDMSDQIIELSETRSLKRAVSWASGVGIVSYQELAEELEGGN